MTSHMTIKKWKTFSVFPYSYSGSLVEVWENEKLKWEHKHVGQVFPAISSSPKLPQVFL